MGGQIYDLVALDFGCRRCDISNVTGGKRLITPDRIRQRRHRARVRAEVALQPVEAATARAALEAMLRLREQLRKWVNSPKFAQLPPEKQIPIHALVGQVDGSLESFALHHRQLADRITKVLNAETE